jgi:DNA repair protein RecO (recombination protein O)
MNILKTKGIVLKGQNFRDSSLILTLFTQKFGKLKLLAKGIKSPKSRMGGNLQQFSVVEIVFYRKENSELHLLSQVELLDPQEEIYNNLTKLSYASAVLELVDRLTVEEESHPGLFSLVAETLHRFKEISEEKLPILTWSFTLRLAANLGYCPNLSGCTICNRKEFSGPFILFSVEQGGLVCKNCSEPGSYYLKLSKESWQVMKQMLASTGAEVGRLEVNSKQLQEISEIIMSVLEYHAHTQKNLKSLEFLEKLKV